MGRPGVLPLMGQTLNSDTLLPHTVTNVQLTRATVVLRAGACERAQFQKNYSNNFSNNNHNIVSESIVSYTLSLNQQLTDDMCTSEGAEGLRPPDSGKTITFRAKAKFFGQRPATKNEKIFFCIY